MSSLNQDDYHQRIAVLISIWEYDKVDRRVENRNKESRYCGF